jgi:uncharacterized Zn finger protein
MMCPVCKTHEQVNDVDLHTAQFNENILTCRICGTVWSVNHGLSTIVRDVQAKSFLEAQSDSVEGGDFCFAA